MVRRRGDAKYWVGLVGAIFVALAAQAHDVPEPWNHIFTTAGAVGAAIMAYNIHPRRGR